jgi:hypothetical protein
MDVIQETAEEVRTGDTADQRELLQIGVSVVNLVMVESRTVRCQLDMNVIVFPQHGHAIQLAGRDDQRYHLFQIGFEVLPRLLHPLPLAGPRCSSRYCCVRCSGLRRTRSNSTR